MSNTKSTMDYNVNKVRTTILDSFRKKKGEAAIADIVSFTGLPLVQVQSELPAVADEYSGRLRVTDSGEILYSFPNGFHSRYRGFKVSLKKFFNSFLKVLGTVAKFLFKIWIMVMLVGYFVLFIALVVLSIALTVVSSSSVKGSSSRKRGGGGLTIRLIDLLIRVWFYNDLLKSPEQRRAEVNRAAYNKKNKSPLYKSIFSFVFGDGNPNENQDNVEKQAFIALVRIKKGVILLEDFMSVTGLSPSEADIAINRYLYEFEGEPEVTEDGTVYYHFESLLKRARDDSKTASFAPLAKLEKFSSTTKKANTSFCLINTVNLAFGLYFLICSNTVTTVTAASYLFAVTEKILLESILGLATSSALFVTSWILGVVPIVFSVLFWLVPLIRKSMLDAKNEKVKESNLRKLLYSKATSDPEDFKAVVYDSLPESTKPKDKKIITKLVDELAAYEKADPKEDGSYKLTELCRNMASANKVRSEVSSSEYSLGGVVFDSNENLLSDSTSSKDE